MSLIQCTIKRDKSGLTKKLYPKYDMIFSDNDIFIMTGQKMQLMRSAHYVVTLEKETMIKKAPGYLGKLRSNLGGAEFNIFDKGDNPSSQKSKSLIRNQHGAITYV